MSESIRTIVQVDAFASRPFTGNPAAVCVLGQPAETGWMQAVANEMNLSETAFLWPVGDAYQLRWFTPRAEVDLCGHATLASAHVLWTEGHLAPESEARFDTRSGRLTGHRDGGWIDMDFPAEPAEACESPSALLTGLGVEPIWVGRNRMDYLVELASEAEIRAVEPNMHRLRELSMRGVIISARAESGADYDFVSRFFAPLLGVDEDPVTGSAHCALGPHWSARLGRNELVGRQASKRGGTVRVSTRGSRVVLGGQAVTVLRGQLLATQLAVEPAKRPETAHVGS